MSNGLEIKVSLDKKKGVCIVQPVGRIDETTNPQLSEVLYTCIDGGNTKFLIDFSELDFLASPGIGTLAGLYAELAEKAEDTGKIKFCNVSPTINHTFKSLGFDIFFEMYDSRETCLNSFN